MAANLIAAARTLWVEGAREELKASPVIASSAALYTYLCSTLAHAPVEKACCLYLDAGNRLIADEPIGLGSVSAVACSPREIMRHALNLSATGLIIAHNHPSGDPTPSNADLAVTREIADAARLLDIILHDHVIIARTGWRSLRDMGLL